MTHRLTILCLCVLLTGCHQDKHSVVELMSDLSKDTNAVHEFNQLLDSSPEALPKLKDFWKDRAKPVHEVVPKTLKLNNAVLPNSLFATNCFGYTLALPWGRPTKTKQKEDEDGTGIRLEFSHGQRLSFLDPSVDDRLDKGLSQAEPLTVLRLCLPEHVDRLGYAFFRSVRHATPSALVNATSAKDYARVTALLLLKEITVVLRTKDVFEFETAHIRGFQFGNPATSGKCVLEMFDSDDERIVLAIWIKKGGTGTLSQSEINTIITAFRKSKHRTNESSTTR